MPTTSSDQSWTLESRELEIALESSWVYSRNASNELDRMSLRNSIARSSIWSILTGKSLSDISVLSVYRLPITLDDITQLGPGLTFERILLDQQSINPGPAINETEKEQKVEDTLPSLPIKENAEGVNEKSSAPGKAAVKAPTTNVTWGNIPKRNVLYLR